MSELISVSQAEALIAEHMPSFGSERVRLDDAAGRVLRQSVHAEHDHPPFDRVMMDGIATLWSETLPQRLHVAGAQMAGMRRQSLSGEGDCLEVTTGAMLPHGSDCVIPVEQVRRDGDDYVLGDDCHPFAGQFIHRRGSDCVQGARLLSPGMRLGPAEMALLAANGVANVEVASVPSVAIVSTGDELVDVGAALGEGQIRRSNDTAVRTALRMDGFDRVAMEHIVDDEAATRERIAALLERHDVLLLSGGVSMGQRDYVPAALAAQGVRKVFHRIAQKPGKPMWFGIGPRGQAVFALPGNPVSALVCATRYARPALLAAQGMAAPVRELVSLSEAVDANPSLASFLPARVESDASGRLVAYPVPSRTSGDFSSLPRTQGFVQLPPGQGKAPAGTVAAFYRW
ncbi:molybdopterin molybdotransferase MoeA [Dyella telluris]|uniref:Molybdopterin molybdenumtransferase n=1 Tax=Dyella telluris TaxID=2763498 RepID=A0A7G8Q5A9_9GAMM|nr:molybdopterin molybdotransferase MoeA [Dyella telluris]QNK01967.1 molybdopterin molybdotransferase MoeA [Dyella telluris]